MTNQVVPWAEAWRQRGPGEAMLRLWCGSEDGREEKLVMSIRSVPNPEPSCRDEPLKFPKNLRNWVPSSLSPI